MAPQFRLEALVMASFLLQGVVNRQKASHSRGAMISISFELHLMSLKLLARHYDKRLKS